MRDDTTRPLHSDRDNPDDMDNQIDELLPAPAAPGGSGHDDVDSAMDTLLPTPGHEHHSADDATTREELEVDTTDDGIDDIIDPSRREGDIREDDDHPPEQDEPGDTGPDTIDGVAVGAEIDPDDTAGSEYAGHNSGRSTGSHSPEDESHEHATFRATSDAYASVNGPAETENVHQCPACGAAIGSVAYCPVCGTDQYPDTRLAKVFSPLFSWTRPLPIRTVFLVGALLVLLALLGDSGTNALVIAAIMVPIALLIHIALQVQHHASISWIQIGVMLFIGLIGGLPLAWLAARLVKRSWFDTGVLNFGAAGFGGDFAEAAGVAPFFVWLVVGFLVPIVIILGIGAAPAALRMVLNHHPAESTGMVLSATVATGFVIASAVMYYRPLYSEMAPRMSTSQWTLTILGLGVIRPLVWVFGGAMIGAVVWRFLRTASPASVTVPAAIAAIIPLGFAVLSLAAGPAGHWVETLVGLGFAVAAVYFYRRFLTTALRNDASLTGA